MTEETTVAASVFYNAEDLMSILHVGRNTAYSLMNARDFPSIRIGKKLVVRKEAFEEWIRKKENKCGRGRRAV